MVLFLIIVNFLINYMLVFFNFLYENNVNIYIKTQIIFLFRFFLSVKAISKILYILK